MSTLIKNYTHYIMRNEARNVLYNCRENK